MAPPFTPPEHNGDAFNCPFCGAYSRQRWYVGRGASASGFIPLEPWMAALCERCNQFSLWRGQALYFPDQSAAPPPNPDLPEEVVADYTEAASILGRSPRGAAALLRLAIQKLCRALGEPGDNSNQDIKALVAKGLPRQVQQALDVVRVVGNNAVHPGELDLQDDTDTASRLFDLVNIIGQVMISQPKQVEAMFEALPQGSLDAIERRDTTP